MALKANPANPPLLNSPENSQTLAYKSPKFQGHGQVYINNYLVFHSWRSGVNLGVSEAYEILTQGNMWVFPL